MKYDITHRPRPLAAAFAVTLTALILSNVESMAQLTFTHERALAAASLQPAAASSEPAAMYIIAQQLPPPSPVRHQVSIR